MGEVSHTNPQTGETFTTVYTRGPAVADGGTAPNGRGTADGGAVPERDDEEDAGDGQRMKDVEHTAPNGDEPNEVWERGDELSAQDEVNDDAEDGSDGVHE
nr:hypothetical protein [Halobium salinum]